MGLGLGDLGIQRIVGFGGLGFEDLGVWGFKV